VRITAWKAYRKNGGKIDRNFKEPQGFTPALSTANAIGRTMPQGLEEYVEKYGGQGVIRMKLVNLVNKVLEILLPCQVSERFY
jgi:hypothetical protein